MEKSTKELGTTLVVCIYIFILAVYLFLAHIDALSLPTQPIEEPSLPPFFSGDTDNA